jgi:hypothetical protein
VDPSADGGALKALTSIASFIGGLAAGGALFVVSAAAILALVITRNELAPEVRMSSAGDDVSASGGQQVLIEQRRRNLRLNCRGACDDFQLRGGEEVQRVRVVNGAGHCVACRDRWPWNFILDEWSIGGAPELHVRAVRR